MAEEYLDKNGLSYFWNKIKNLFLGKSETAAKTRSIPYGELDTTSTSTVMTAQVDGITELRDGVCVLLRNGIATSTSGVTLNINGLGAKPIYSTLYAKGSSDGKVATRFNVGYTILFVYSENWVDGGAWLYYDGYDSNTNTDYTLKHYYVGYTAYTILYRYQILLSRSKTELLPINTVSNGYNKTDKALTTEEFDPFGKIFYYGTTTTVQAGAKIGNNSLYEIHYPDLRYSFNIGSTLTANKPVFIVCVPQSNGMARLHTSPISQELPTSEDGLLYIYLGQAWSTYQVELFGNDYPVYKYVNGRARRVMEDSLAVNGHTVDSDVPANAKFTDTTYDVATQSADGLLSSEDKTKIDNMGSGGINVDHIYPVGSIYMSVNNTNPSTLFGGTWKQIEDRFLLSAGGTYTAGETGGEAAHKLTAAESGMPSHGHGFTQPTVNGGAVTNGISGGTHNHLVKVRKDNTTGGKAERIGMSTSTDGTVSPIDNTTGSHNHTLPSHTHSVSGGKVSDATGKDAANAHNNMPPYLVVYMWERTA